MKYLTGFVIGLAIGILLGTTSLTYAFRMGKPIKFTQMDEAAITQLNDTLEQLWDITNGRYTFDVTATIPTATSTDGDIKIYSSGGVYRIYIYLNGSWRSWTSD